MKKISELYSGKAKTLYTTDKDDLLLVHFRDDTSAFDGLKVEQLPRKGMVNNYFNAYIMSYLQNQGIPTHFIELYSDTESIVRKLDMIPVECVIRNIAAGSICRRLGIVEGTEMPHPIFEFFLKNDALHDPMINESHILTFNWASEAEIEAMKALTFQVNELLKPLFMNAGMILVDYKLEFGRSDQGILLGDEFTPDGCRLWDVNTREKLDKDRFRRDMGNVIESYEIASQRLGIHIPS
ncbi:MAG: phosphoribosylaminoimidazolesuccinocarboxamide synthase [Gammaproteobacteria bacterium]|nr:phosphoribosylaminoimidazolesuccinocarboxamide synthase [Gammaproteobacteria bacterium]